MVTVIRRANPTVFQSRNGFAPFGQFTRNLSNKSQKIVLSDAFGNVIDNVEYFDSAPWPTAPDGGGSYLLLMSTAFDNNLASSWVASTNALEVGSYDYNTAITIYPNPATNVLTVSAQSNIDTIELLDISGKLIKAIRGNSDEIHTDITELSSGMYFVKVYTSLGIATKKLIKY